MPEIVVLPHAELCPEGKTFEASRGESICDNLLDHGIAADRLTSHGYGEEKPVDPHHTQQAYKLNRRVAFVIVKREKA